MSTIPNIKNLVFKDTSFATLMRRRVYNVLLIATKYDAFMLEDDGRVDEQIFNEYTSLNLRYPPRFTQVTTQEEAMDELSFGNFELIICMPNMDNSDTFAAAKHIKEHFPHIPIVVLTPFSKEVSKRVAQEDLSAIDYVFSWLGNTELLLAIIKLIEDKMNVEADVSSVGVQVILLVEDSVRFYSSALPLIYRYVLEQSKEFSKEALNEHNQMLRMRGRPKVLLARNYEEAVDIYTTYEKNMLGIICDMSFKREGMKDKLAGYKFGQFIRKKDPVLPFIFESSESINRSYAYELNASFIDKGSKSFPQDLRNEITQDFGFGDFVIINPVTRAEIMRIRDLKDLQVKLHSIPDESLIYHLSRNHFSRFFYSRAMFPPAELLRSIDVSDFKDMNEARQVIFDAIVQYRKMKNTGVIAIFKKERFDEYSDFARIGNGSLGGKGRGLAFMGTMIKRYPELNWHDNFAVRIPKTVVICTDIFDQFMDSNNLYPIALTDLPDEEMLRYFLRAKLPVSLVDDLMAFFEVVKSPIAVRSSSLLEDSHYQPFAGIYSTYMVPHEDDKYEMLRKLSDAIKGVYASVFFKDSKAYMTATSNVIDQEKMAIVLQEVVGNTYGDHFYPTISGVARSLNFYPIGNEKAEDGIVNIALGLGKYIVDGGQTLRFSPQHPHNILQLSTTDFALRETQVRFYALDLKSISKEISIDDSFNLLRLSVKEADKDGSLRYIVSTYDPYDQMIREGYYPGGRKIISFSNVLQHDVYPLASTLNFILKCSQEEMGRPVEIEFAMNIDHSNNTAIFYLLQVRPIVDNKEMIDEDLREVAQEDTIISSCQALGHGIQSDVFDIVYVKSNAFNASKNQLIAYDIEKLNKEFVAEDRGYVLVGPGRWGSSDTWLGIPVKWPHISMARVIVESGLENYRIEPSQGTHFFQNLTSFGVGYFTINPFNKDGWFDEDFLNAQTALHETEYLRHVRFEKPIVVKIDGKKSLGVVLKP